MAKIGIKIANGEFYPILDDFSSMGKKLSLTTVRDGQPQAQIDFYSNNGKSMSSARYLGSLVVDELKPSFAEETVIALQVKATADGRLLAEAYDSSGDGGTSKLEIDLNSDNNDAGKDFSELGLDGEKKTANRKEARRVSPIIPIIIAAIVFIAAAICFLFLFWINTPSGSAKFRPAANKSAEAVTTIIVDPPPPEPAPPEPAPPEPAPPVPEPADTSEAVQVPSKNNEEAGYNYGRKAIVTETTPPKK